MNNAVFFCENCSNPVPLESTICPHCGSHFTAVQCPKCSFVGVASLFSTGCPQCGYLAPAAKDGVRGARTRTPRIIGDASIADEGARRRPIAPAEAPDRRARRPSLAKSAARKRGLPGWFYAVTSVFLVLVLVLLVVLLFRMR